MKDLPVLTDKQLRDVISHDFPLYKAQYLEWEKNNPQQAKSKNVRRRPKLPGRLDFDEFRFIVEVKYNYQSTAAKNNTATSQFNPQENI